MTESFDLEFERTVRQTFVRHLAELDAFVPADIAEVPRPAIAGPLTAARPRARIPAAAGAAAAIVLAAVLAIGGSIALRPAAGSPSVTAVTPTPSARAVTPAPATAAVGVDWTVPQISKDAGPVVAVAAGVRGWAAVSGAGTAWHSDDGAMWQRVGDGARTLAGFEVTSLVTYPDGFLAVATATVTGTAGAVVFRSSDGLTWSRLETGSTFANASAVHVAWGPGGFVAAAGDRVWRSADGSNWSDVESPYNGATVVALAGSSQGYLLQGQAHALSTGGVFSVASWSPDGSTWISRQLVYELHSTTMAEAAIGADGAIVVGETTPPGLPDRVPQLPLPAALASTDGGLTWISERDAATLELSGLASDGATIWGLAADGRLMRSTDGSAWREVRVAGWRDDFPGRLEVAAAGPQGIAITGSQAFLWFIPAAALTDVAATPATAPPVTPPPPPTPTPPAVQATPGPTAGWTRATWGASLGEDRFNLLAGGAKGFVGISGESGQPPTIEYSADGLSFERADASDPTFAHAMVERLVGTPNGFVAIGLLEAGAETERRVIWTSSDGLQWRAAPTGTMFDAITLNGIDAGPSGVMILGSAGGEAAVWLSEDGMSWRRLALDPTAFAGATLYAAGGTERTGWLVGGSVTGVAPTVWRSRDLVNWTRQSIGHNTRSELGVELNDPVSGFRVASGAIVLTVSPDPLTNGVDYVDWRSTDGRSWSRVGESCLFCLADGTRFVRVPADDPETTILGSKVEVSLDGLTWRRVPLDARAPFVPRALGPRGLVVATEDGQLWYVVVR